MKRAILTITLLSAMIVSFSQQDTALQKRLKALAAAIHRNDINNLPDFFHAKMFTYMSKKDMRASYKAMSDGPDMIKFRRDSLIVKSVSPVFNIQDTNYARVNGRAKIFMTFKIPPEKTTAERKKFKELLASEEFQANIKQRYNAEELSVAEDNMLIFYIPAQHQYALAFFVA
jgi:hypothetical protein